MSKLILYKKETIDNVIRLQSQLLIGTDTADFVLEKGVLKHWDGNKFVKSNITDFEITEQKTFKQQLCKN